MAALQRERPVSAQKVLSDRKAKKGKKAPKKPLLEVLIGEEKQLNALVTSRAHTMKPATPKDLQRRRVICLLYTSPSPRDATLSRMPSSA